MRSDQGATPGPFDLQGTVFFACAPSATTVDYQLILGTFVGGGEVLPVGDPLAVITTTDCAKTVTLPSGPATLASNTVLVVTVLGRDAGGFTSYIPSTLTLSVQGYPAAKAL